MSRNPLPSCTDAAPEGRGSRRALAANRAWALAAVLGVLAGFGLPDSEAEARRRGGGRPSVSRPALRVGMRTAPLPPSWTWAAEGLEEAPDAPHEAPLPGGLAASRVRGAADRAACLAELRRLRIPFRPAPPRRPVRHPVELLGPLHGVTYKALYSKRPPLVDCHFALGLEKAARVLATFGVTTALYTSTFRPAPRRTWRSPGHHPAGMAIDINELVLRDGTKLVLLTDWEKLYGGPGNCVGRPKTRKGRLLRQMTCALERAHVFRRILSPDSDFPHRNHWHISGARIGEAFTRGRWCGRTLDQPLPGDKGFDRWYYWYSCWKFENPRTRYRCYTRRARRKPRARGGYRMVREVPRVAIWLPFQLRPAAEPELPASARSVELPPALRSGGAAPPAARPQGTATGKGEGRGIPR